MRVNLIPIGLFHRILVEIKGLYLKNKTPIKTLSLVFHNEIRYFQAGRNPRDDKVC